MPIHNQVFSLSLSHLTMHHNPLSCSRQKHKDQSSWFLPFLHTLPPSLHRTQGRSHMDIALEKSYGASLVAQWLRTLLPMQGTRVRALVWEDPTCRGATKPVRHNY